jgi:hypothetical protein
MTVIDFQESDLPTRLRNDANHPNCDPSAATLEREAATEIERLTTENETLRAGIPSAIT